MPRDPHPTTWWLRVFFAGFLGVFVMMVLTWFTPVFHGDLARMARVSERDYAGTLPQPTIEASLLVSTRFAEADVLVVGDSFSIPLHWQSVLVRQGLRVKTLEWRQIPGLCADFGTWVRQQGFTGSLVVAQIVGRELNGQLKKNAACSMQSAVFKDVQHTQPAPLTQRPGFALNWTETLSTGIVTTFNTWRAARTTTDLRFDNVSLRTLPDGCRYFSHRLCDRVLLLARDAQTPALSAHDLDLMAEQGRAQQALRVHWVVVPDKTSVYFDTPNPTWAQLPTRGLGPNLLPVFQADKEQVRDLYLPDDTHLSTTGYLRLGALVRDSLPQPGR